MARDDDISTMDPIGAMLIIATALSILGIVLYFLEKWNLVTLPESIFSPSPGSRRNSGSEEKQPKGPPTCWEIITNSGRAARDFTVYYTGPVGFSYRFLSLDYLVRLLVVTLFFAFASYINSLAAVCAGHRTPNIRLMDWTGTVELKSRILPDLGHDMLEIFERSQYFQWISTVNPDIPLQIIGYCSTALVFMHPKRLMMLRRVFAVFGYVNVLRAICVIITSLPDSSPRCASQFGHPSGEYKMQPMFPQNFKLALLLTLYPSSIITCGDMIFSGHTVMLCMCAATISHYFRKSELDTPIVRLLPSGTLFCLRAFTIMMALWGMLTIMGTRLHYTVDVLIAIYITFNCWTSYHNYTELVRTKRPTSILSLYRLFAWLEAEEVISVDKEAYQNATNFGNRSDGESKSIKKAQ